MVVVVVDSKDNVHIPDSTRAHFPASGRFLATLKSDERHIIEPPMLLLSLLFEPVKVVGINGCDRITVDNTFQDVVSQLLTVIRVFL